MPAPPANPSPQSPAPCASTPQPPPKPPGQVAALRVAIISGAFCALVAVSLVAAWAHYQRHAPLDSPLLASLKTELLKTPQNEALKERIRAEDLRLRTVHKRYLNLTSQGAWLLAGGAFVLLASLQFACWRKKLCAIRRPRPPGAERRALLQAAAAVAVLGGLLGVTTWWLAGASETHLSGKLLASLNASNVPAPVVAADFPSVAELQQNWPRFRGPDGSGVATATNLPLTWDETNGVNIVWKVPAPPSGFNSPLIWGERLFLSEGDATNRAVSCFDTKTGALLWRKLVENVPGSPAEPQEISEQTGFAAATMATDGRRVYAFFANGDLAAFRLDGTPAWSKGFGPIHNQHGHATSLLTWQDRLILQLDQGESDERKSKLYALEAATGKIVWQKPRALPSSWATPISIQVGDKPQLITLGIPLAIAYSPADGAELWRAECLANEVTPSPIFAGGFVLIVCPSEKLLAYRPDGSGDVTKSHLAWFGEDGVPDVTSPVSNGDLVFTVNSGGLVVCYEVKTGKKLWEHDYEMEFQASPIIAGDRLYLVSQKGPAFVVQVGREFKQLARAELADKFYASPAVGHNRIYLRGLKTLYCLGASGQLAKQN